MDITESQTTKLIAQALDGVSQRHKAIVGNIANAETPGYQAVQVSFEDSLKQAIQDEKPGKPALKASSLMESSPNNKFFPIAGTASSGSSIQVDRAKFFYTADQNGVDIDHEMAELARNSEKYSALSKLENKAFAGIKAVIKGSA